MEDIVIAQGARTPMGGFQGSLKGASAIELASTAIAAAIDRANLSPSAVDDVIMGCVLPAGLKQGPARQAARQAGLPDSTHATTINKLCGSGMKAVMFAHDLIRANSANIVIAGGMESMTNAPFLLDRARSGYRMGHGQVFDHMFLDGLEDAETGRLMGSFAQDTADHEGFTREQMDAFAIESLKRAQTAIDEGYFEAEITPVTLQSRKGDTQILHDEQPGNANIEKIPTLRPAFAKDGTVTAANSSSISDGASALIITTAPTAAAQNMNPLAKIVGHSTHSRAPSEFTLAPIFAIESLIEKIQWSKDSVDLWEINEAFAMVTMAAMKRLELNHETVNIHGGACALGHPVGSTGSRIILSLIHALKRTGGKRGVAALCIGGGEATAMGIELI